METLKSFFDQSLLIWKDSTAAARFGISLLLMFCAVSIVGVGIWSSQPEYVLLAGDLNPAKVSQLIDALDAADIPYQQKGASAIWVDKRKRARAQSQASKLKIAYTSTERIQLSPWEPISAQKDAQRLNMQMELKRMIEQLDPVDEATVILGSPERQSFIRDYSQATASVTLSLAPNAVFGPNQASSIASMVANGVPDLTPENVSITDTEGKQYMTDPTEGRMTQREEFRMRREQDLAEKAERVLFNTIGFGNYTVTVMAEFTFPEEKTKSIELDSENKVAIKEIVNSNSKTEENKNPLVPVGIAGNNGSTPGQDRKEVKTKTEDLESEYRVPETEKVAIVDTPVMERMSVAVVINSKVFEDEDGTLSPERKTALEADFAATLHEAVGHREGKDSFRLSIMPFVEHETIEAPSPFMTLPWDKINQVLKNLSLGLAALVALFVAFKALRKIQPDPALAQEKNDRETQVIQLSDLVKQNPEVFSKIIESWSSLDSEKPTESQPDSQEKAA